MSLTHIERLLIEANGDKLFESLGEVAGQLRRRVLGDEEEDAHGVQVRVRWLACSQLYGGNPQGPYIRLWQETHTHTPKFITKPPCECVYTL